jgi:homoserine O-acetyltransferase
MHYTTLGTPIRGADGHVTNAVMILHGTGGDGHQFFRPQFADVLFAPGGLLDPAKYYIILPDGIGHGKSSKPSDGLHAKFPRYDYDDMVQAEYRLATEGLGVDHLRLLMGTSMGCMHSFVLAETRPDYMDAVMPLACLPTPIAGRNRVWRRMLIDAVQSDPAWKGGEYSQQPAAGLRAAADLLALAGATPLQMQKELPTRDAADKWVDENTRKQLTALDANDLIFQVAASRNYDPSPRLGQIKAKMMWINSADDFINPPELGIAEREAPKLKTAKFVLIPTSDQTHGHGTHTWADVWKGQLADLLKATESKAK